MQRRTAQLRTSTQDRRFHFESRTKPAIKWNVLLSESLGFLATFSLVVNSLVGTLAALGFIIFSAGVVTLNISSAITGLKRAGPFLFVPALAILSTIWSDAPNITLRASLQLAITLVFATTIAQVCSTRKIILALMLGYFCTASTAILQIPDAMTSSVPIRGLFESKNAFGVHSQMLSFFCMAILFDRKQNLILRFGCIGIFPYSLLLTFLSQSGGALLLTGLSILAFPALLIAGNLGKQYRIGIFVLLAFCTLTMIPASQQISNELGEFRENVLNKDATLTGRTDLWVYANSLAEEAPILGHGYNAFWREGNPDAESIWRKFGIASKSGFNFHNEYFETNVALGAFGTLLIALCFFTYFLKAISCFIRFGSYGAAFSMSFMIISFLRSLVEVSIFTQFSINLFVLLFAYVTLSHKFLETSLVSTREARSFRTSEQ